MIFTNIDMPIFDWMDCYTFQKAASALAIVGWILTGVLTLGWIRGGLVCPGILFTGIGIVISPFMIYIAMVLVTVLLSCCVLLIVVLILSDCILMIVFIIQIGRASCRERVCQYV